MLTTEIAKLLDKLYNLRGDDSVVLTKIERERISAEDTKKRTASEKMTLQDKIEKLSEDENVLKDQGEKLISALSGINNDDFKFVLDKLNVNFNPEKLKEDVDGLLPETIKKINTEIKTAKDELLKVESEMNTAITTIEELAIRKDEAISNQARLNEYFDLALNGNINITRDSITSLLEKFDFNEDEQREAAKILMFPEDALYEYENKIKNVETPGKSISEVFAEAIENVSVETNEVESKKEEEIPSAEISLNVTPKDELIKLLKEVGFDYLEFTGSDLDKIVANYNESDLRNNVEYALSKNIKLDLFIDNVELLYDKELKDKIERLIAIGKEPFDIYLNPNVLVKYNKDDLNATIEKIVNSGLDPKKVPLLAY